MPEVPAIAIYRFKSLMWVLAAVLVIVATRGQAAPRRIVSAYLGGDEIALELLRRAGQLERIAGLSRYADDPQVSNVVPLAAATKARVDSDPELIVALRPDLVLLASYSRPELITRIKSVGLPYLVLGGCRSFADVRAMVTQIADAIGLPGEGKALRREFDAALADIRALPGMPLPPRVLRFYPNGTTSGANTAFDEEVTAAGGIHVARSLGIKDWPLLSPEVLLAAKVDVLVVAGEEGERRQILERLGALPGWRELGATRAGRVILVPARELDAVSHHVLTGVRRLAEALRAQPWDGRGGARK